MELHCNLSDFVLEHDIRTGESFLKLSGSNTPKGVIIYIELTQADEKIVSKILHK